MTTSLLPTPLEVGHLTYPAGSVQAWNPLETRYLEILMTYSEYKV